MICECSDPQCAACKGECQRVATATLYRVDMDDQTGTAMCSPCADDAMQSDLFTADPDDSEDEDDPAQDALANAEALHNQLGL